MLEYIALNLLKKDKYVTTNIEQCRYLAKLMLDSAETKGMKPPTYDKLRDSGSGALLVAAGEWEVEDD